MLKRVSLKDIANKVGVSTALVSYVLNNQKEGRISKEIAQKIRETAASLNYRPNQIAKSLKTNKTNTIGLVVADISNSFSSGLARFIEDEADRRGYTVIYGSSDENVIKAQKLIDTLLNRQVDGLILLSPADSESQLLELQKQEIPFVLVDRYFPDLDTNLVCLDNYAATYEAVKHLASNNRERIGMINYDAPLFHMQERKRGYLEAIKNCNLPFDKKYLVEVNIKNDEKEIQQAVESLLSLESTIDALILASNTLTVSALRFIKNLPLKVPEDLAIVGFDETDLFDFFYSPLSYIRQPLQLMGETATNILIDCINNNKATKQITLPPELVIRKSSVIT
jgi:LacI family transcriptional regulator